MKWLIMRASLFLLGAILFTITLVFEIDGVLGFLLTTIGIFLIGIGLTLRVLINLLL